MKKNNLVKQSPLLNRNASGDDAIRKKRDGEGFQINSPWLKAAVSGKLITHREVLPVSKALHQLPNNNVKKKKKIKKNQQFFIFISLNFYLPRCCSQ